MRTIKFRGKDKETGEWFYGNLFDKDTSGRTHISTTRQGCLDIDPETVGQLTGLHDKNGAPIYEGDIVKFRVLDDTIGENVWKEYTCEVSFCNGCFCTDGTPLIKGNWKGYDMVNVEIIGNIHDNPELQKGSAE